VPLQFLLTSDSLAPLTLDTAPVGWQSLRYLLQRDEKYHGVALTVTSELTFWKQGAAYLRTLYEGGTDSAGKLIAAQGVEALCVLTVFELDVNEFRPVEMYRGRVDFTQYRSSEKGVLVKLKELGFATAILARADQAVDLLGNRSLSGLPLPQPDPLPIFLHSQVLRLKYEGVQATPAVLSPGLMSGHEEGDASHEQLLYFGFSTTNVNDLGVQPAFGGFVAGSVADAVPIYQATADEAITLELRLAYSVEAHAQSAGGLYTRQFKEVDEDIFVAFGPNASRFQRLQPRQVHDNLDGDYVGKVTIPARTFTAQLKKGEGVYLFADYFVHRLTGPLLDPYQATLTATMLADSYVRITAQSTTTPSLCRGLLVHEALARTVEAMTDQPRALYSEYFGRPDCVPAYAADGPGALRLLTTGFLVRGFPTPTDTFTTGTDGTDPRKAFTASFQQVFEGLNAIDCLGCGPETRQDKPIWRVEPRAYFYQPTVSLELDTVQLLTKAVHLPALLNAVEVGYQHWQSGAQVGLDEFNGQRAYSLPLTQVKNTYSALSSLNTAGYLLEETRRARYEAGTSKEGNADAELFLISLRRPAPGGALVTEKNEAFASVTGILSPETAYNLRLSPGRNLRRHGAFLRAGLIPQAAAGKKLLRGAVLGNDKLVSRLVGEVAPVNEAADVVLTELAAPILTGETYEFTALLRPSQLRALTARPYGLIGFLDSQRQRKTGYLLKLECEPASGKATFTLLRAAA
jgi:hypothetical protein